MLKSRQRGGSNRRRGLGRAVRQSARAREATRVGTPPRRRAIESADGTTSLSRREDGSAPLRPPRERHSSWAPGQPHSGPHSQGLHLQVSPQQHSPTRRGLSPQPQPLVSQHEQLWFWLMIDLLHLADAQALELLHRSALTLRSPPPSHRLCSTIFFLGAQHPNHLCIRPARELTTPRGAGRADRIGLAMRPSRPTQSPRRARPSTDKHPAPPP